MGMMGRVFTVDDLAYVPDDGKCYEIVEGELVVSPSPNRKHQRMVLNCAEFLRKVERARYGQVYVAPFDVVLDDYNVTEPDVLFVREDRLSIIAEANVQGAPDLVVEVLSSNTRGRDLGLKARLYARYGVNEYWVVDPDTETLTVWHLTANGYREVGTFRAGDTYQSPLCPTIPLEVSDCFIP